MVARAKRGDWVNCCIWDHIFRAQVYATLPSAPFTLWLVASDIAKGLFDFLPPTEEIDDRPTPVLPAGWEWLEIIDHPPAIQEPDPKKAA